MTPRFRTSWIWAILLILTPLVARAQGGWQQQVLSKVQNGTVLAVSKEREALYERAARTIIKLVETDLARDEQLYKYQLITLQQLEHSRYKLIGAKQQRERDERRDVREQNDLSLSEAVRKMSGLAAETFRLGGYGVVQEGAQANLVAFNPQTVIDRATFEDPKQYPDGIEHVIVEGEPVIRYGEQHSTGAGVPVKLPGLS